jgi:hypothetical protein
VSDRLNELRRQRALAQEQVDWFDREIARESGAQVPPAPSPAPVHTPLPAAKQAEPDAIERDAQKILERYRHAGHPIRTEVRKGCYIYFVMAFVLVGLIFLAVYFFLHNRS